MAGLHGKNAELRLCVTETSLANVTLYQVDHADYVIPGLNYWAVSGSILTSEDGQPKAGSFEATNANWRYGPNLLEIDLHYDDPGQTVVTVLTKGYGINYAAGAIVDPRTDLFQKNDSLKRYAASGIIKKGYSMQMYTVGELVGSARNITIDLDSSPLEVTTLNESWRTYVEGMQGWTGTMENLWLDNTWFNAATSSISGTIPHYVIRARPDPYQGFTYYQGTAFIPNLSFNMSYDAAIGNTVTFNGIGPLDSVIDGVPGFKLPRNDTGL